MKVLLIGDGARENSLAFSIAKSGRYQLYAFSSYVNPGIKENVDKTNGKYFVGDILSKDEVKRVISQVSPDFGVIGPEDPLFNGAADAFREEGIPVVGPSSKASTIEKSKVWMRNLMWKYNIPGRLRYRAFNNLADAAKFVEEYGGSIAIKPSEQVGGKGVKVVADIQAYLSQEKRRAASRSVDEIGRLVKDEVKIIIEEKVDGPEYTLHVLTDGRSFLPLPLAQDYKHAYQDGIGPETGGMGSISGPGYTLPFIDEDEYKATFEIVKQTAEAIKKETGDEYVGFISGQMMLTELWGPTVIEFYSRLGDPEASAIVPRITSDFGEILELAATGKLNKAKLEVDPRPSIVRAIAPLGYPLNRDLAKGKEISLDLPKMKEIGCQAFFGAISLYGGKLITTGSRALELVAIDDTYEGAVKKLDLCTSLVSSNTKLIYRTDIGRTIEEQVEKAEIVRYSYKDRIKRGVLGASMDWSPNGGLW
ncbi:MAG: phosphoribosylamine--glycine ligase [Candidatus Aramenus sulfurataquae]|jgi:phosphoribosylamine--glycine ligase|uniref:phosphoribosylamine--glycine ligase n=2 Tax=Candidatus Aramenus sulfurataquae TaxID=1326980 RepID=W7L8J0_9CREN|nr:MAG: phosphoribosylamine--glycine ligase [Candidatus Aramenus sulfurataquae]MCL7343083.1 phosphoribosylamine--glycine ligase [Candidatus Aramenus sulfurataquae]